MWQGPGQAQHTGISPRAAEERTAFTTDGSTPAKACLLQETQLLHIFTAGVQSF